MLISVLRFSRKIPTLRMLTVAPIPALDDNYMYVVYDSETRKAAAVDPVEPVKIKEFAEKNALSICAALVTHHHWDHAGEMEQFRRLFPEPKIYGGDERIACLDVKLGHEQAFSIEGIKTVALSTPCHTRGHICYYIEHKDERIVFTGDTLFIAGCGKFFEGTADEMHKNLNVTLAGLPDDTRVYPGHEYTSSNLRFAKHIEPSNQVVVEKLDWALACNAQRKPTVPSTIGEEKQINPFMRVDSKEIQDMLQATEAVQVMAKLREAKNNFKAR